MLSLLALLTISFVQTPSPDIDPRAVRAGPGAAPDTRGIDFNALAASEYEFTSSDGDVSAPCRAQGLVLLVSARGLQVTPSGASNWSAVLATTAVGREGRLATTSSGRASSAGAHARLDRGAVSESFENRADGVKHSWTIGASPAGIDAGPLLVVMNVEGDLALRIRGDSHAELVNSEGSVVLLYQGLTTFDADGKELRARFVHRPEGVGIEVNDRDARYPITIDPVLTGPVWSVESDQAGARLGYSVAGAGDVNGDGFSDVIVGAPDFIVGGGVHGRVWLFLGSPAGLASVPIWMESGNAGFRIGHAISGVGDVNGDGYGDFAVMEWIPGSHACPLNDTSAIRLHYGSANPSSLGSDIRWIGPCVDRISQAVCRAGDVDGDGFDDVLVARGDRAELFLGSSSGLVITNVFAPPCGAVEPAWSYQVGMPGSFGLVAIAGLGDIDADGRDDVAVGSRVDGSAYVFRGFGLTLEANPSIVLQNAPIVARAGDVDGDGYADLLVGTPAASNGESGEGRAFLHRGGPNGISVIPSWSSESNQVGAAHGSALGTIGDVNGDGYADIAIGAPGYDGALNVQNAGRVSVHLGSPNGLTATPAFVHEGGQADAAFGQALSGAGDVDGDGFADLLVGAPGASNGQALEGRAFVFRGGPSDLATFPIWSELGSQAGAEYGASVAHIGDLNADGFTDFAVGAFHYDGANGVDCGQTFVYLGGELGSAPTAIGFVDGPHAGAEFGNWVAAAGDVNGDGYDDFIVGARGASNGQSGEGRVFVYHGSSSGFVSVPAASFESNQSGASLGQCVASAGDVNGDGYADVIVGAHLWDQTYTDVGKASVYLGSPQGLQSTSAWSVFGGAPSERLGSNVASAGDVDGDGYSDVLVGVYDANSFGGGIAYLFRGTSSGLEPSASWFFEISQINARLSSLAGIGDVNGDGYSDVALGSPYFDGSLTDAGRVFVFLGGASGLASTPTWTYSGGQVGGLFGTNVAAAGDVNGDGYADLLATAILYDGGQTNEGAGFVFLGSASGLSNAPAWRGEIDQDGALLGISATGPGDVNGDGFADILLGGLGFGFTQQNQGSAYLFLGNGALRGGAPIGVRQRRASGAPLALGGATNDVHVRLRARAHGPSASASTPFGRGRARLEWQLTAPGAAIGTAPMQRGAWASTGAPGSSLDLDVAAQGTTSGTNIWRARVAYDDALFPHGPWLSLAGNSRTELDFRSAPDCDGNGVPDAQELAAHDCDSDGVLDACEILAGATDCDGNGQPDGCQLVSGDCNQDTILDVCQLVGSDCDANGVLDECDLLSGADGDCDADGILDGCEIAAGDSDCDQDGRPDSCQIAGADCNGNGVLDSCDIASGMSPDANLDGIPDSCQTIVASYCFGDGSGASCPCGNVSATGRGCPSSANSQGALLVASGLPSRSFDTFILTGSGMTPSSSVLYYQGTSPQNGGLGSIFGDGLRCAAGSVLRLGTRTNVGGTSSFGPGVAVSGQIPSTGGTTRYYQAWYRDISPSFCTTSRFNLTNGVAAVWIP